MFDWYDRIAEIICVYKEFQLLLLIGKKRITTRIAIFLQQKKDSNFLFKPSIPAKEHAHINDWKDIQQFHKSRKYGTIEWHYPQMELYNVLISPNTNIVFLFYFMILNCIFI